MRTRISLLLAAAIILSSCKKEEEPEGIIIIRDGLPKTVNVSVETTFELVLDNFEAIDDYDYTLKVTFSSGDILFLNNSSTYNPHLTGNTRYASENLDWKEYTDSLKIQILWKTYDVGPQSLLIEVVGFTGTVRFSHQHRFTVEEHLHLSISNPVLNIPDTQDKGIITLLNEMDYTQRVFYWTEENWLNLRYAKDYDPDDYREGGILIGSGESFQVEFNVLRRWGYTGPNSGSIIYGSRPKMTSLTSEVLVNIPDSATFAFVQDTLKIICFDEDFSQKVDLEKAGSGTLHWELVDNPYFSADTPSGDATTDDAEITLTLKPEGSNIKRGGIIFDSLEYSINGDRSVYQKFMLHNYSIYKDFYEGSVTSLLDAKAFTPGPGIHKMLLIENTKLIPMDWLPGSIDEVEIIGHVSYESNQLSTCQYGYGTTVVYKIERFSYKARLTLWEARTRDVIVSRTFSGSTPTCPDEATQNWVLYGSTISDETIFEAIEDAIR